MYDDWSLLLRVLIVNWCSIYRRNRGSTISRLSINRLPIDRLPIGLPITLCRVLHNNTLATVIGNILLKFQLPLCIPLPLTIPNNTNNNKNPKYASNDSPSNRPTLSWLLFLIISIIIIVTCWISGIVVSIAEIFRAWTIVVAAITIASYTIAVWVVTHLLFVILYICIYFMFYFWVIYWVID